MITIVDVLLQFYPDTEWGCDENKYEGLHWSAKNTIEKPSKSDIEEKLTILQNAEPMRLLRIERDRLIQQTDWWVLPDRTATPAQLAYRQALRDLPANSTPALDENGNLTGVEWPVYSEEA